jgi:hypothetical protein
MERLGRCYPAAVLVEPAIACFRRLSCKCTRFHFRRTVRIRLQGREPTPTSRTSTPKTNPLPNTPNPRRCMVRRQAVDRGLAFVIQISVSSLESDAADSNPWRMLLE